MMASSKAKFVVAVVALVLLTGGIGAIFYGQVAQRGSNANTVDDGKQVAGKQVIVETHMLRLDTDKIPANIRQLLSQPVTRPADSFYLTSEQREQLLKAVSDAGGEVLASPTLLLLDGTEAGGARPDAPRNRSWPAQSLILSPRRRLGERVGILSGG